jgi:hypothetical protein
MSIEIDNEVPTLSLLLGMMLVASSVGDVDRSEVSVAARGVEWSGFGVSKMNFEVVSTLGVVEGDLGAYSAAAKDPSIEGSSVISSSSKKLRLLDGSDASSTVLYLDGKRRDRSCLGGDVGVRGYSLEVDSEESELKEGDFRAIGYA